MPYISVKPLSKAAPPSLPSLDFAQNKVVVQEYIVSNKKSHTFVQLLVRVAPPITRSCNQIFVNLRLKEVFV